MSVVQQDLKRDSKALIHYQDSFTKQFRVWSVSLTQTEHTNAGSEPDNGRKSATSVSVEEAGSQSHVSDQVKERQIKNNKLEIQP